MGLDWTNPLTWIALSVGLLALPVVVRLLIGLGAFAVAAFVVVVAGACAALEALDGAIRRVWRTRKGT